MAREIKVLLVCPSKAPSTGNLSTANRIQIHLNSEGISCTILDVSTFVTEKTSCSRKRLKGLVEKEGYTGLLFLHTYKGAKILLCNNGCNCDVRSFPAPYGIIFGGTDINVDITDAEKRDTMQKVLKYAKFAVAFTEVLKENALQLSPKLKILIQPQAVVIPENVPMSNPDINDNFVVNTVDNNSSRNSVVFLMVTGIRPVKDPLFILEAWIQLCISAPDQNLKLLILGPVLDDDYAKRFFSHLKILSMKFKGYFDSLNEAVSSLQEIYTWFNADRSFPILYAKPLPNDDLKALMCSPHIFATVNSSISEGMSSAILESMSSKIPVIARDNSGNKAVTTHDESGLLFHTPDEFVLQVKRLIDGSELRDKIISNAFKEVLMHHSPEKEKEFYYNLCKDHFSSHQIN